MHMKFQVNSTKIESMMVIFCDFPHYDNIIVQITFNSKAGGRRPTAGPEGPPVGPEGPPGGPEGPQPSAGARRRGALAPRTF